MVESCAVPSVNGSKSSVKKKRKRGESGRVESEEDGDKKKKKQALRPNYFVSVPITNPKVRLELHTWGEENGLMLMSFLCLLSNSVSFSLSQNHDIVCVRSKRRWRRCRSWFWREMCVCLELSYLWTLFTSLFWWHTWVHNNSLKCKSFSAVTHTSQPWAVSLNHCH